MRKRLLLLFGGFALLLAGAGLAVILFTPKSPISRESYERIQPGMTEGEVEAILGGPSGNYTSTGMATGIITWVKVGGTTCKTWAGDEGTVFVYFDESGMVASTDFWEPVRIKESFLNKLRRWLGF